MDSINLTITERLMLTNQFRSLEILDLENAKSAIIRWGKIKAQKKRS